MRKKKVFFCLFSEFFRFLGENFSAFWPRNFKKMWKLPSACPQEQLVTLYLLKKFWTVLDFLQKPLAWFSKFYLRVQSKNFGRNSFLIFLFRIFFGFWAKNFFRLSAKKLQEVFKTTFYVSRGTVCGLKLFSKNLNRFGFSAETFGMILKILSTCPE